MQTIFAKARKFVAGIVIVVPDNVPKLAGFPDVAALVSVQVAVEKLKELWTVSVMVTGLTLVVTVTGTGVAGVAVFAAVVVIAFRVPLRLVAVNAKGPPWEPVVIFWTATVGMAGLTKFV